MRAAIGKHKEDNRVVVILPSAALDKLKERGIQDIESYCPGKTIRASGMLHDDDEDAITMQTRFPDLEIVK